MSKENKSEIEAFLEQAKAEAPQTASATVYPNTSLKATTKELKETTVSPPQLMSLTRTTMVAE
jgi:hypothetical protein